MYKRITRFIILCTCTILLTSCALPSLSVSYNNEGQSLQPISSTKSNLGIAEFHSNDLTVIPNEELIDVDIINSTSSLLINRTDNELIYADNIYQRMYPASLTKLITALVVLEQGNLDDIVTISKNASSIREEGAKLCGFREGDKVDLESLLNMFLIYSGNDAGIALAEYISGSEEEFAKEMNKTARRLGAVHSNFINSHGLHHYNHYTTTYDLYLIFNELLNYQEFLSIIKKSSVITDYERADGSIKSHQYMNTNRYLLGQVSSPDDITVAGGKTGTTSAAGSCLILYSLDNSDKGYISLIMQVNSGYSLYDEMNHLLDMIK